MKRIFLISALLSFAWRLPAQTNEPVKLALLAESSKAADAAAVLTAQLSSDGKLRLLERTEIEKVYSEQGLSAGNKDYLKLGQLLGSDGLLLLDMIKTKTATNVIVRLIAVKPGVVLSVERFSLSESDLTEWASSYANHLEPLLPKLSLLVKDAVPISVVNLRCATPSAEAPEVERQLKLLTIERLSQERQFFVLERQRMQSLAEEKELNLDDSTFWNGSYLLEGVVDQNGYAKDTITINARLTPPKGGAPLLLAVSGSRTNFAEVINRLAAKVEEALKINAAAPAWNGEEEATQYYNDAKWALQWKALPEAQVAADAAWALGKRDLGCAMVRVRAYMQEASAEAGEFGTLEATYSPGYNADGVAVGPPPSDAHLQSEIKKMATQHPWGMTYEIENQGAARTIHYAFASKPPDPQNIDRALHALDLYYEFSRNSPEGEAKVGAKKGGSEWYYLGVEDLASASQVLQSFNLLAQTEPTVAEKLAGLRALARSVAGLISQSPSVHDSYFVGDRSVTHDELGPAMQENPNIFRCKVNWGCYWEETPEDTIALYRELMSSAVFCYVHQDLWLRPAGRPRVVAWNENDRRRIPVLWESFVQELENSPDLLHQLEAKAFAMVDAGSDQKKREAFTNFFNSLIASREALLTNNVEVVYLGWGSRALVLSGGVVTELTESLKHVYYHEYRPKLNAMDQEYWTKALPALQFSSVFQRQKKYLKDNKPYEFFEFANLFNSGTYSKAQALEIQPLIASYKSNLVAQAGRLSGAAAEEAKTPIFFVDALQNDVNKILNPPAPKPRPQAPAQAPKPATVVQTPIATQEIATNVLTVGQFLEIPMGDLQSNGVGGVIITAHHWVEGKLLLDLKYGAFVYSFDAHGNWSGTRNVTYPAIALLDPKTGHWDVIGLPEVDIMTQNFFYHRSTLWRGEVFTSDGKQIKKYDFATGKWKVLEISDGNNYELFTVNEHLYAADRNTVFEIINEGNGTRLMASARRQPPASALDAQELGTPTLCEGPGHSLRIVTPRKIFTWMGNDWREDGNAPSQEVTSVEDIVPGGIGLFRAPEILADGVLFLGSKVFRLGTQSNGVELCLERSVGPASQPNFSPAGPTRVHLPAPTWKMPQTLSPARLPMASRQSDLYCLVDHSEAQDIVNEQQHLIVGRKVVAKGGYHAELLCFSRGMPLPQKLFLKFDAPHGCPPAGRSPAWMFAADDYLFFGLEQPPIGFSPVATPTEDGYKAGVWLMPVSRLQ